MKLPRRQFLHLAAGAVALTAFSGLARALPSSSGITANASAWTVYARRLAASVREGLFGQI